MNESKNFVIVILGFLLIPIMFFLIDAGKTIVDSKYKEKDPVSEEISEVIESFDKEVLVNCGGYLPSVFTSGYIIKNGSVCGRHSNNHKVCYSNTVCMIQSLDKDQLDDKSK